jgi:hypothetical protein
MFRKSPGVRWDQKQQEFRRNVDGMPGRVTVDFRAEFHCRIHHLVMFILYPARESGRF